VPLIEGDEDGTCTGNEVRVSGALIDALFKAHAIDEVTLTQINPEP
jgi:hypothetical protein